MSHNMFPWDTQEPGRKKSMKVDGLCTYIGLLEHCLKLLSDYEVLSVQYSLLTRDYIEQLVAEDAYWDIFCVMLKDFGLLINDFERLVHQLTDNKLRHGQADSAADGYNCITKAYFLLNENYVYLQDMYSIRLLHNKER